MERLQKAIANSGYTSRRKAESLILEGKVYVNGIQIKELGTKVSPQDIIVVDGVTLEKVSQKEYYLLNKPRGYICSVSDDKGRKVVTDLIDTNSRIYPVGRLDYDTTGVLLLTNEERTIRKCHLEFQTKENGAYSKSLEEAIRNANRAHYDIDNNANEEALEFKGKSKTEFALDLISNYSDYTVPEYIKLGLVWLNNVKVLS